MIGKRIYLETCSKMRCTIMVGLGLFAVAGPHSFFLTSGQKPASSRPATIKLNAETIGTTADISPLSKTLQTIFADRRKNRAYAVGMETRSDLPESDRIERTVLIQADRGIQIATVTDVIEAVLDAGAGPVLFPTYSRTRSQSLARLKPNPLTLVVQLKELDGSGSQGNQPTKSVSSEWGLTGIPVSLSSTTSVDSVALVQVGNEGEFTIDKKRIAKTALEKEIRDRIRANPGKKIISFKAFPGVRFGGLEDAYQAAFAAGAKRIELESFINWEDRKTVRAPIGDLVLTVPAQLSEEVSSDPSKNGDVTWTTYYFTWVRQRLALTVDVTVTNWDKDFPPETGGLRPEALLEQRYALTEREKSSGQAPIEELSYLELDGVKGIFFRATQFDDKNRIWLNWQTLRYHKDKAQQLSISVRGLRSDLDNLRTVIESVSFADRR